MVSKSPLKSTQRPGLNKTYAFVSVDRCIVLLFKGKFEKRLHVIMFPGRNGADEIPSNV